MIPYQSLAKIAMRVERKGLFIRKAKDDVVCNVRVAADVRQKKIEELRRDEELEVCLRETQCKTKCEPRAQSWNVYLLIDVAIRWTPAVDPVVALATIDGRLRVDSEEA